MTVALAPLYLMPCRMKFGGSPDSPFSCTPRLGCCRQPSRSCRLSRRTPACGWARRSRKQHEDCDWWDTASQSDGSCLSVTVVCPYRFPLTLDSVLVAHL